MTDDKGTCSHPRMCVDATFAEKIKTEKLALTPPPAAMVHLPPDR
jgi:hypothetical protein